MLLRGDATPFVGRGWPLARSRRWWAPGALLDFDFRRDRYYGPPQTFSRASGGYAEDSSGVYSSFGSGVLRRNDLGALIEEARTNSIRNSVFDGAVAGTPGTNPTYSVFANPGGTSRQIVASGPEYVDVRFFGTSDGNAGRSTFEASNVVAAAQGQTWTHAAGVKLIAGAIGSATFTLEVREFASGTASGGLSGTTFTPTSSDQRVVHTRTLTDASATNVQPTFRIGMSTGVTYDFTLRFSLAQLEQGAFATSPVRTTTAAATRAADVLYAPVSGLSAATIVVIGRPRTPVTNPANQFVATLSDGGTVNRTSIYRVTNSGIVNAVAYVSGGATTFPASVLSVAQDARFVAAAAFSDSDRAISLNGNTTVADATTAAFPSGLSQLHIGNRGDGGIPFNGRIERVIVFPTRKTNAELQAMSQLSAWGG